MNVLRYVVLGVFLLCPLCAGAQDAAAAPPPAPEAAAAPAPAPEAAAPPPAPNPLQVNVSVKIIEFQTVKGLETGLSAYFKQRNEVRPYLRVSSGNGNITSADVTFPTSTFAGITVFMDRISTEYGDIEAVIQGLVEQNRAFILAQPRVMVVVGQAVPTVIMTTQDIPFEDTRVIGSTAVQVTTYKPTGVTLNVKAISIIDDDGNPKTTEDSYINLELSTSVKEEGQRIAVALDDQVVASSNPFSNIDTAISVPEFISREIITKVWVRHGQVLILGGLYRDTRNKELTTLPWLTQGSDMINAAVQRLSPVAVPQVPLSAGLGSQNNNVGRRELVFMVRAEVYVPIPESRFGTVPEDESNEMRVVPSKEMITDIVEGITEIPKSIGKSLTPGQPDDVTSNLGGDK